MPPPKRTKAKASENPMDVSNIMEPYAEDQFDEETQRAINCPLNALGNSLGLEDEDFGTVPKEPAITPPEFHDDALGNEEGLPSP